jgi:hypothetical protein
MININIKIKGRHEQMDIRPRLPPQTSLKTICSMPDTAVRVEGKGSSLAEASNAVDGVLQTVLSE